MPPALKVRASGANGTRPPAEPLHPVLPNATENPEFLSNSSIVFWFWYHSDSIVPYESYHLTSRSRKVKNAKHGPKTCNETMVRNKMGIFASHSSPPF